MSFLRPGAAAGANVTATLLNMTLRQLSVTTSSGNLDEDMAQAIDTVAALVVGEYTPLVPALLNGLLAGPLRTALNAGIMDLLRAGTCPRDAPPARPMWAVYCGCGVMGSLFVVAAVCLRCGAPQRSGRARKHRGTGYADERDSLLAPEYDPADYNGCLALHGSVGPAARYGIPFLIAAATALLFYGVNSSGGVVFARVRDANGTQTDSWVLYSLDYGNSILDMWHARA